MIFYDAHFTASFLPEQAHSRIRRITGASGWGRCTLGPRQPLQPVTIRHARIGVRIFIL